MGGGGGTGAPAAGEGSGVEGEQGRRCCPRAGVVAWAWRGRARVREREREGAAAEVERERGVGNRLFLLLKVEWLPGSFICSPRTLGP